VNSQLSWDDLCSGRGAAWTLKNVFGRSANVTVSLPYGVGNFHGTVVGAEANAYVSFKLVAPTGQTILQS